MKKLIVVSLFSLCMLVIGSAFANIEKQKQKVIDDRTEVVASVDQVPTIDGDLSSFFPIGVVENFFVEERPITSSELIEAKVESYQNVTVVVTPASNSPPFGNNPFLHRDPGLY